MGQVLGLLRPATARSVDNTGRNYFTIEIKLKIKNYMQFKLDISQRLQYILRQNTSSPTVNLKYIFCRIRNPVYWVAHKKRL